MLNAIIASQKSLDEQHLKMQRLYRQLTQILNEARDGAIFQQFAKELGYKPVITPIQNDFLYEFRELGVSLNTLSGRFVLLTIHLRSSDMKSYKGDFPCGIESTDGRDIVEQKLGRQKIRSEKIGLDVSDCYDMPSERICFHFTGKKERMCLVTARRRRHVS